MSKSKNKLTRHEIRESALTLLYQLELTGAGKEELIASAEDSHEAFGLVVTPAVVKLSEGVLDNKEAIDEIIQKYSSTRKVERISKINLVIMRIALYEMDYTPEVPDKAAMNEAIELSKEYAYKPDSQLISGVLGAYYKDKTGAEDG